MRKDVTELEINDALHRIAADPELLQSALADHCLTNDNNELLSWMFTQSRLDVRQKFINTFLDPIFDYCDEKDLI